MTNSSPGDGLPPVIVPELGRSRPAVSRWRWLLHLLLLSAYPLVIGGLALLGEGKAEPALSSSVRGLLAVSGMELALFGTIFAIAWWASRADRQQLYLAEPFRWWFIPASVGYSIALRVAVAVIAAIVAGILIVTRLLPADQVQEFILANRPDVEALVDVKTLEENPLYMFLNATLVSFVVAGLREELWRAGVLAGLKALWPSTFGSFRGQLVGVGVAAIIFGLGHLAQGLLATALTGLLGLFLGIIMVYHRSIWPAVLAHGAFNATTFVLLPWALKYIKESGLV